MSRCGTTAGYNRHRSEGEDTCRECRAANAAYHRAHYRRPVSAAPIVAAIDAAKRAGIDCGTTIRDATVPSNVAEQIDRKLRKLIAQRFVAQQTADRRDDQLAAMVECLDRLDYARERPARVPADVLRAEVARRWPPERRIGAGLKGWLTPNDRRAFYRAATLDLRRAERICRDLGIDPETVWPDWS